MTNEAGEMTEGDRARIAALRATLDKELAALLAHPLVPEEFRKVFEEQNQGKKE